MRHCWGTMTMPHTRSGHDQDRSRNMRTRNRRLGPLVQHPPPPPPGRHHTTTNRKSTHNNTKGSGLNKPPQNPGLDTHDRKRCTRYVALHPLRGDTPEQKGCNAYGSGAAHPITRTNAESARRPPTKSHVNPLLRPRADPPRHAIAGLRAR